MNAAALQVSSHTSTATKSRTRCLDLGFFGSSLLAILFFLVQIQTAHAERVFEFQIRLDGKLALVGDVFDEGEAPDVVWKYLTKLKFKFPANRQLGAKGGYAEGFEVKPDADNPLHATLTGNLLLYCRYGGVVDLTSLKLVREKATDDVWRFAPEEVERTFKIRKIDAGVIPLK